MKVTRIGMDTAKNVFQLHGVDRNERVVLRKRLRRARVLEFFATLEHEPGCVVGLEATGGAHYWARELAALGYAARMMNPAFVKPYVKGNKSDARDAEAICEAASRATMRFIAPRTLARQDVLTAHRIREQALKRHTALVNQTRGLLAEYGIVVAKGPAALRRRLPAILEDGDNGLSAEARAYFAEQGEELAHVAARVKRLTMRIRRAAAADERCRRVQAICGVGPLTASAFVALIGDGHQFQRGRQCAAWLGLVPRQHSSGERVRLLGISKRGNRYLRTLFVHGARAALRTSAKKSDPRSRWAQGLAERRPTNVAVVALAAKNVRTAWALVAYDRPYQPEA